MMLMMIQDTSHGLKLLPRKHKKWHKSPHNRFKQLFTRWKQATEVSFVFLLANTIVLVVVCVPTSNDTTSTSSSQQANSISITKPSSNFSMKLSEEEVDLAHHHNHSNESTAAQPNQRQANVNTRTRQARIYRIRAAVDGKLSLPVRINVSSNNSSRLRMAKQMANAQNEASFVPQNNTNKHQPTKMSEFGARATIPTASSNTELTTRRLKETSDVGKAKNNETTTQKACGEPTSGAGSDARATSSTSIAATSPTLHLIVNSNKRLSSINRPLVNQPGDARASGSRNETTTLLRDDHTASGETNSVSAIEVDESSEPLLSRRPPVVESALESSSSAIDDYDSKMVTNRTKAHLSCDSGEMVLRLNFTEPFRGIVYPDHNRLSPCRFFGDGHNNYELRLPLRGCGTRQAIARVFVNDVIVRFHKTLELEEDEVKTLICRYPPPVAQSSLTTGLQQLVNYVGAPQQTADNFSGSYDNHNGPRPIQTEVDARNRLPYSIGPQAANFELIDTSTGSVRQRLRQQHQSQNPALTANAIETMSESLLVAPAGGYKTNNNRSFEQNGVLKMRPQSSGNDDHHLVETFNNDNDNDNNRLQTTNQLLGYGTTLSRLRDSNSRISSLDHHPASQNGIRNKAIILANPIDDQAPSSSSMQFFDRLSSIELLFLISSLMFIALMALGLTTSYYCFRRRRRLQRQQTASSMLRAVHHRAATSSGKLAHRSAQQFLSPQQYYTPSLSHNHHLTSGRSLNTRYTTTRGPNGPLSSASSPDSDLSGRGHLLTSSSIGAGHYARNQFAYGRHVSNTLANGKHSNFPPVGGRRNNNNDLAPTVVGRATTLNRQRHLSAEVSKRARQQQNSASQWHMLPPPNQPARIYRVKEAPTGSLKRGSTTMAQYDNEAFARTRSFVSPSNNRTGVLMHNDQKCLDVNEHTSQTNYGSLSHEHEQLLKQQRQQLRRQRNSSQKQQEFDNKLVLQHVPTSDNDNADDDDPNRKSRLVLKRIDDSYVTNITEVIEQEHMEYDSTRPLGWAEWRRMAAESTGGSEKRHGCPSAGATSGSSSSGSSSEEDDNNRANTLASVAGGMRSLTEVDVDFTRSLLRNATRTGSDQTNSANQLVDKNDDDNEDDLMISPEYACERDGLRTQQQQVSKATEGVKNENKEATTPNKRLELVASPTSQDSVSYV